MRPFCYLSGGCKFLVIHEWLLKPDAEHAYARLYRISECPWCKDPRATMTSPEPDEARCTLPRRWLDNGITQEVKT